MTIELEPRKFRRGENASRPWGGNVSGEAFPQALYNLAVSRGYESQMALARALGKKRNSTVRRWYQGKTVPLPAELEAILALSLIHI